MWTRQWDYLRPLYAYPPDMRRLLYKTNAIESLHMQLRKIIKTGGHLPTDEAAMKLLSLAVRKNRAPMAAHVEAVAGGLAPPRRALFGERFTHEG
jgi:transposase-like protein